MFDQIIKLQQMAHNWRESTSVMELVKMILTGQDKLFNLMVALSPIQVELFK